MSSGKPLSDGAKGADDRPKVFRRDQQPKPQGRIDCEIKDTCGTCAFINSEYESSLDAKYQKTIGTLKSTGLLDRCQVLPYHASPLPLFYRTHAKVAVRPSETPDTRFAIGLFKRGTHEVVDMDYCPLHKDSITRALKDLRSLLNESELTPYNESDRSGDVRYIAIRASHLTDEIMVTVVCTSDLSREVKAILKKLKDLEHHVASGYLNINSDEGNNIFGDDSRRLIGADRLRENLCGLQFEIGPTSFFQVNPWQADKIYRRVEQLAGAMPRGITAWDLYCGTGTMSMILARSGYRVLGIEENPQATRDAESNVRRNEFPVTPNFMAGRVEDIAGDLPSWAVEPQLILANPSRRGMADQALQTVGLSLAQQDQGMFIYVSCEAETLIRDIEKLKKFNLSLRQIEAFDMFPYTEKLEWIAVLVRES
ncbi:23S rRNA (uracil(1939)-C(5))-methyltransferase RlmD [Oligoflexaceae bacterium]|nr:23S rRNA (uracil(1939)-C(5))-methyltransferase RlmD [Oligoflexaceae bacterium]